MDPCRRIHPSPGGEFRVVDPVGSAQSRLQLIQFEGVAGMAPSELLEFDVTPAARGSLHVPLWWGDGG